MIQNCILNLYPLSALKCGPPGAKRSGFPLQTWVFAPRRGPSGQSVQRGGAAEGFRSFSDQPPRGHGVEPRRSAPSSSPSHLSRSRLPRTCASPALRLVQPLPARAGGRGLGLASREIASRCRRRCSRPLTGGVCAAAMFGCYAVAWETGCA